MAFYQFFYQPLAARSYNGFSIIGLQIGLFGVIFSQKVYSVCNLSTKEHKSKSAAITQTGNRVQNLAGVRNETKSSESKFGKAQVSIC